MALFPRLLLAHVAKHLKQHSAPSFQAPRSCPQSRWLAGRARPQRTRRAAAPPFSRPSARRHRPLPSCTPLLVSSASPTVGLPPPAQAPEPGSGYSCRAERTRGRGKCFRGSGPRVGVCKLASVPAGAAAAERLARCAGAWRRRRAAGGTAGGRAWQVGARPRERRVVRAVGLLLQLAGRGDAAREGGGEGRRGAWRKEGARRGRDGAARARARPGARRVTGRGEGGLLGGPRTRARTLRSPESSPALL